MRIHLLVPDCLHTPMGGMGEHCRNLISAVACVAPELRFDITGTHHEEPFSGRNFDYQGLDELHLPLAVHGPAARTLVLQLPIFTTAMRAPRPDIVQAFDWSTFSAGIYLARHWKVPLIASIHLSIRMLLDDHIADERVDRQLLDAHLATELQGMLYSSAVVHVSQAYADRFPAIFDAKSFVVPNGIDLRLWRPSSRPRLPGRRPIKLVYIGRFDRMKNIDALLEARLPKQIDLIFIGSNRGGDAGIHARVLHAAATRDDVHYLGPLYGQDKINALCAADAVIVPSLHEPFGIVALEALASKSILLSSLRGGMRDFLDDQTAIDCGTTADSISRALTRLVDMTPKERNTRIAAGLELCRQYTWQRTAQMMAEIYHSLAAPRSRELSGDGISTCFVRA